MRTLNVLIHDYSLRNVTPVYLLFSMHIKLQPSTTFRIACIERLTNVQTTNEVVEELSPNLKENHQIK